MTVVLCVRIPPCFFELSLLFLHTCPSSSSLAHPCPSCLPRPFSSFLFSCIFTLFSSPEVLCPNSPRALQSHCEFSWNFSPVLSWVQKLHCTLSVHRWQYHIANSLIITAQGTLLSSPLYLFVISHNMQSICWPIISEHFVTPKNININSSFKRLHKRLSVSHQSLIFLRGSWWRRMKISKTVHWTSFLPLSWFHCQIK